jgi:hypothetical protein
MTNLMLATGLCAGAALLALLLLTITAGRFRIWPTPGDGT